MVIKRVLRPDRLRRVPPQFSWVDQHLVRDGYLIRCDPPAPALYLPLVTEADAKGLNYGDAAICRLLSLESRQLQWARRGPHRRRAHRLRTSALPGARLGSAAAGARPQYPTTTARPEPFAGSARTTPFANPYPKLQPPHPPRT